MATSVSNSRREEIARATCQLLEMDRPSGLSMRRLADQLGIRAQSLHKHIEGTAALEREIIAEELRGLGDSFAAAEMTSRAKPRDIAGSLSATLISSHR
ncbi:MAG TPA: hypothetical protein VMU39_08745 [Solirubrobacteraceae bacterium]|nr:hypothetical protein [Solirubrobacteraceae bacterium]